MRKVENKIKNAKRVLHLLNSVKTSKIHDRNLNACILGNCIRNVENSVKNIPGKLTRMEQLDRMVEESEKFLIGIARRL